MLRNGKRDGKSKHLTKAKAVLILAILALTIIVSAAAIHYWMTPKISVAKIGIFYYTWYDPSLEVSWDAKKIIDQPILGFYNSSDPAIIRQHLVWIEDLGVDFVVLSWWGFYDDYGKFTENVVRQVLSITRESGSNLKIAVMVEPFNQNGSAYDYATIYNHIYSKFVLPFSSVYYDDAKPLVCFFNNPNLTDSGTIPQDERFKTVLVGQEPYVQWIYTDLNYYVKPLQNPYTTQVSVTPRYDDSHVRTPSCVVDADLTEGIYDQEWRNAIQLLKDGKIDTIMITSWNEYPERTAIEPHHDATTSNLDPWFLYNKTRSHIQEVRLLAK